MRATKKAILKRVKSESQLTDMLGQRFHAPEFAFMRQVRNCTGYAKGVRTADAMAMGLWPSRGLDLHGFECKSSVTDLKKELDQPEKAEEIAQYCNYWWLVLGHKALADGLIIPAKWGILVPRGRGLIQVKKAEKLEPAPLTHDFLAAILRRAAAVYTPESRFDEVRLEAYQAGRKEGIKVSDKMKGQGILPIERDEKLRSAVDEFEKASGVRISQYSGPNIGEAMRQFMHGKQPTWAFENSIKSLEGALSNQRRALAQVKEANEFHASIKEPTP